MKRTFDLHDECIAHHGPAGGSPDRTLHTVLADGLNAVGPRRSNVPDPGSGKRNADRA